MLRRISHAIEAGRRAAALSAIDPSPLPAASWALVHFDDPDAAEGELVQHRRFCRSNGYRCLVVSDRMIAPCIGADGVVFEFAPWPMHPNASHSAEFPSALDYTFRRLSLIFTFWYVAGSIWTGRGSAELLELAPDHAHPLIRVAAQTASDR